MGSIKNRFLAIVSVIVIVTMIISTFITFNLQKSDLENDRTLNVNLSIAAMSNVIGPALWNYQDEIVEQSVKTAFKNPNISKVIILDVKGELKYGLVRSGVDRTTAIKKWKKGNEKYHSLVGDGEQAGQLAVVINDDLINERLSQQILFAVIQGLAIMGLVIITLIISLERMIFSRVTTLTSTFKDISEGDGDLSTRINYTRKHEIGLLVHYFNQFVEKIHAAVKEVVLCSDSIESASQNLKLSNQESKDKVGSAQQETTMVATAIHQLSQSTEEIARNALSAADRAEEVKNEANTTREVVDSTCETISGLSEKIKHGADVIHSLQGDVKNIVSVLDVIRGIAEQTNLLALNAAIEAARAGEQGRGFAVVADEVRALASRTQDSTTEIQGMIERLQSGSDQAVAVMDTGTKVSTEAVDKAQQALSSLEKISSGINTISEFSTQIAAAIEESSMVTREVNENVNRINDVTVDLVDCTVKSNKSAESVDSDIMQLKEMLSKFKL